MKIDNSFIQYQAKIKASQTVEDLINGKEQKNVNTKNTSSFSQILDASKKEKSIEFSRHAQSRMEERDITLDEENIEKLSSAISAANEKGIQNTLVLMNNMAFIVHVPDNLVITAMKDTDVKEQVFTNIDGTVVV